jgi:nucleoside-diphosphate-sugar epimerase
LESTPRRRIECGYRVFDVNSGLKSSFTGAAGRNWIATPDSEYGWEKLFSERLYLTYGRCYGMDVRLARYDNIFGLEGTWAGGREKAPAALCRKIAIAPDGATIEIWGDGRLSVVRVFETTSWVT